MNVCGILVHTTPDATARVAAAIALLPGADVHADAPDGRLIVTTIDTDDVLAIDQLTAIHRLPGVVAASLVYHQLDSEPQESSDHACSCGGNGAGACKNSQDTPITKDPLSQPLPEGFHHG